MQPGQYEMCNAAEKDTCAKGADLLGAIGSAIGGDLGGAVGGIANAVAGAKDHLKYYSWTTYDEMVPKFGLRGCTPPVENLG